METQNKLKKAFSLIEITIVVMLVSLVAVFATPYLFGAKENTSLQTETDRVVDQLRLAQQKSIASEKGLSYGLKFDQADNSICPLISTLPCDEDNDKIILQNNIKIELVSTPEIIYTKLTGMPSSSLDLTLSSKRFQ